MKPKISICIPIHDMKNGAFFLWRAINSIMEQTFTNYEIVITKAGSMPVNSNAAIQKARGELVKILYMDDWLAHPNTLKNIVDNFKEDDHWLITGADTNPTPHWTEDIETGNNKLGSPSALTMRKHNCLYFDEKLSWLLDCDLYKRLYLRYGKPKILKSVGVNIGIGDHQMTNIMTDDYKLSEHKYVNDKYNKN